MKLILSSRDFGSPAARQTILAHLPKPQAQCRVLFIPNEKADHAAVVSGKYTARLRSIGFHPDNIYIFDYTSPERYTDLEPDLLYVSGGNTFCTLQRLRDCGFDKAIVRYVRSGVIYVGGSAGAHIVTQDISHVRAFDTPPEGMTDFAGLGLFDGILLCHFSPARVALYESLQATSPYRVLALTDDDCIVYP